MSLIALADAKLELRIGSSTVMDARIQAIINSAESWIAAQCGLSFGEQTFTEYYTGGRKGLRVDHGPIRHIISVVNRDTPGTAQIENTDYFAWNNAIEKYGGTYGPFWALPSAGALYGAWTGRLPVIMSRWMEGRGRWLVTYAGGWEVPYNESTTTAGNDDGYPHYQPDPAVQEAVLQLVRRMYDNRGGVSSESASGWSVNWEPLEESDIMRLLAPYCRKDC